MSEVTTASGLCTQNYRKNPSCHIFEKEVFLVLIDDMNEKEDADQLIVMSPCLQEGL